MPFPVHRPRRLRSSEAIRKLVRETLLAPSQFILPLFVCPGEGIRKEISSMPGHAQLSIDNLVQEARTCLSLGIGGVILFGIPAIKDELASGAYDPQGITQQALRALKREVPGLLLITDVCNCEYTSHGHCGFIKQRGSQAALGLSSSVNAEPPRSALPAFTEDGEVDNDITLDWLSKTAVSHAEAGADIVAPSDMMDGRVGAIREALDAAGYLKTPILSYAAKYSSVFYGPFREAAESAPQFGDRRGYQMDPSNAREAMREIALDLEEGADMIIIKPAMPYLDIVKEASQRFEVPLGAYQVSGEFSMIMAAAQNGWLDLDRTILESLTCIRRAGADFVLTYFAKQAAKLLA